MHMKILQQFKEGHILCTLCKLKFQSDELVFHPQTAEDCNWKTFTADQKYKVIYNIMNESQALLLHSCLVKTSCS